MDTKSEENSMADIRNYKIVQGYFVQRPESETNLQ